MLSRLAWATVVVLYISTVSGEVLVDLLNVFISIPVRILPWLTGRNGVGRVKDAKT